MEHSKMREERTDTSAMATSFITSRTSRCVSSRQTMVPSHKSHRRYSPFSICLVLRIFLVSAVVMATTVDSFSTTSGTASTSVSHRQALKTAETHRISSTAHHRASTSPITRRSHFPHRSSTSLWTTSASIDTDSRTPSSYDPFATANKIAPQTKPLSESMSFYAQYLINYFLKTPKLGKKIRGQRRAMWKKLDEQRKNVMTLAGYTSSIVTPSFTFLFLGALMTSIVPNYWGKCIQCVATLSATKAQLLEAIIGLGVTSTLAALFTGIRGSLFWIGGCRANYNVRVKLHRSLLLQEAAFFDTNETGYLLSRLNSDVNKIGQVISYHVNVVLRQFAQFVFGSIYLVKISPKLSLWAFGGIVLVAWLSAVYGDVARQLAEKVQDTFADATAVAETSFSMSETIRAFDGAEIESDKFEAAQSKALELEEVQAWAYGTHKFLSDTLQSILQVGLLVACWAVGKSGGLPSSDLTTFMFYTGFVLESSNEVGDQWAKIQQAVGASSSVFDLIKRIPAIRDPPTPNAVAKKNYENNTTATNNGESPSATSPIIAMKNVTVQYEAMERPALTGIETNIFPGDRVALVGRSGSGKSSMLRTMLRFYDPSSGAIELDGEDLKSLTRAETADQVSLVEQEPHVFPLSLMENVLYGIDKDEIDPETGEARYSAAYRKKVADCLDLAGIPVVPGNELGLDLDTRIGEGGRSLSGGQRQRVAIARVIIRSPQVLLLDEPTAALDSESEKKVVQSLQKAMKKTMSMVMVTHRLGVVRSLDVNRVIVLDRGEIVEEGHPEELLRQEDSLYAALAREQGITSSSVVK